MEQSAALSSNHAAARSAMEAVQGFMRTGHAPAPSRQGLSAAASAGFDGVALPVDAPERSPAAANGATVSKSGTSAVGSNAHWRTVDVALSGVIGQRGTAAVLRQAMILTRRAHGWMPEPPDGTGFGGCVRQLGEALAGQVDAESRTGQAVLETTFHDLVGSLVGGALATRLLRAAWAARQTPGGPGP